MQVVGIGKDTFSGSLFLTRPRFVDHFRNRKDLEGGMTALLTLMSQGVLDIEVGRTYMLDQSPNAHIDLAARSNKGCLAPFCRHNDAQKKGVGAFMPPTPFYATEKRYCVTASASWTVSARRAPLTS